MAGYLGAIPVPQATQHRESFTATSGQTTFNTAGYTVGFLDVYLNGSHLSPADFTATNGSDVVLASGASTGDVCDIISYTAFEVNSQTFTGTTTLTGDLLLGDNDKAIFGAGSDLQIYHDGTHSYIHDAGTGDLYVRADDDLRLQVRNSADDDWVNALHLNSGGETAIHYNGNKKLATTSTGIDVTGTVTADGLTVDTNTLHVDATNNRVGIGTTSPSVPIEAVGSLDILQLTGTTGNAFARFTDSDASSDFSIGADDNSGSGAGAFVIYDRNATAYRMTLDSSGNFGIGATSISGVLTLQKNQAASSTAGTGTTLTLNGDANAGNPWEIFRDNGVTGDLVFSQDASGTRSEYMRIDSSGNVGIGTSSPSSPLQIQSSNNQIRLVDSQNTSMYCVIETISDAGLSFNADVGGAAASSRIQFNVDNSEKMRIDSSGNLLVGTVAEPSASQTGVRVSGTDGQNFWKSSNSGTSGYDQLAFFNGNGLVGTISTSGSATAYNTSSDYRLKTDAQPMTGASDRVLALNPVNFEWIADGTRVDGFLAHEAQAIVPEAVTGTKDAMRDEEYQVSAAKGDIYTAGVEAGFNEVSAAIEASPAYYDVDGNIIKAEVIAQAAVHEAYDAVEEVIHSTNVEQPETLEDGQQWRETTPAVMGTRSVPDMQGIDQSKMVPLLVAALQEALARITALENA